MNLDHIRRDIAALLLRADEGPLSTSDQQWFDSQLRESPAAMDAYLQHIELLSALSSARRDAPPANDLLPGEADDSLHGVKPADPAGKPQVNVLALWTNPTWDSVQRSTFFGWSAARWIGVTVCALLTSYFIGLFTILMIERNRRADEPEGGPAVTGARSQADNLARIVATHECVFSPDSNVQLNGESLGERRFSLLSGVIELQFVDGANVLLQGPVEFEPRGRNRIRLQTGRLVAKVPRQAVGFTVETPAADVVDLGTEFGAAVDETGAVDVHVFRGAVKVTEQAAHDSDPSSPERPAAGGLRLSAGQSVRVNAGEVKSIASNDKTLSSFRSIQSYRSRVSDSPPCAADRRVPVIAGYQDDVHTLHLWHFDDPAALDSAKLNPHTKPLNLTLAGEGVISGATAESGATASIGAAPRNKGLLLPAPRDTIKGAHGAPPQFGPPHQDQDNISTATFWNQWADDSTLGAFTYEAVLYFGSDPTGDFLCSDPFTLEADSGDGGTPVFQLYFRAGKGGVAGTLNFLNLGNRETLSALLPTDPDPDAPAERGWYHMAVTYSGDESARDNLKLYWTRLDVPIGAEPLTARLVGLQMMTADLAGIGSTADFAIGNLARLTGGGEQWVGLIDEARISDIARSPDDFLVGKLTYPPVTKPNARQPRLRQE